MKTILKKIKGKSGFVSIETIIALSWVVFFFLLFVSIYAYNMPRIMLEKEVQHLAQTAKIQGGLTDSTSEPVNSDITRFTENLIAMGYDEDDISISAKTITGNQNAIGVTPINQSGSNYIKRDSKDLIEIIVVIKAKKNLFTAPLNFFGLSNKISGQYTIREVVGSERW